MGRDQAGAVIKRIEKLSPATGDLLVFYTGEPFTKEEADATLLSLEDCVPPEVDLIMIPKGATLELLTDGQLAALGLFRMVRGDPAEA